MLGKHGRVWFPPEMAPIYHDFGPSELTVAKSVGVWGTALLQSRPEGFRPSPSVTLASNSAICKRMKDHIDIDCKMTAGGITTFGETRNESLHLLLAISSGQKSKSEELRYGGMGLTLGKHRT